LLAEIYLLIQVQTSFHDLSLSSFITENQLVGLSQQEIRWIFIQ
jgi:hypothetical protein